MLFPYLHTPDFLSQTLTAISILALPLHLLGAYCILCRTPKMMKSVKLSMLNLHFWSVMLDWGITFFTKPFVLFPAMAGVPFGVLSSFGVGTGEQIYLVVTLFSVVCAAIVSIFENRYYLSFGRNSKWHNYRIPCMLFNYLLAFLIFLPAYLNSPDQSLGLQEVFDLLPNLPDTVRRMPIFVIAVDYWIVVGPVIMMGVFVITEAFGFVVLIFLGATKALKMRTVSVNTIIIQKKFLRALYVQILMIALNMGVPLSYLGLAVPFHYYNQAANNIVFIIYSLHGLTSTIVMIALHKPYRMVIRDMFSRKEISRRMSNAAQFAQHRKSIAETKTTSSVQIKVHVKIVNIHV